jgi:cell wall-associated NlpC family hydrolase
MGPTQRQRRFAKTTCANATPVGLPIVGSPRHVSHVSRGAAFAGIALAAVGITTLFPGFAANAQTVQAVQPAQPTQPADTVAPGAVQAKSVVVAQARYSDALADTAEVARAALRSRGAFAVSAAASPTSPGAVSVAAPVQTQVVVGGPTVVLGAPTPAASADGQSWTSVVLDTDRVDDYLVGTLVAVPVAPTTQLVLSGLPTDGGARYQAALHQVALLVAARISGVNAAELERVWMRTDDRRMTVILTALAQVGTSYRWTGNQPGGFDCSGLTSYSWSRAGVKIPRVSGDQINAATPRSEADLQAGDLVYRPGHIGLYLGVPDLMVHSPQTGKTVEVRRMGRRTRFGSPI